MDESKNHNRLKQMRIRANLSQEELAKKSGVSLGMVRHYEQESKDIDHARFETIVNLANALNCPVYSILNSDKLIKKYMGVK